MGASLMVRTSMWWGPGRRAVLKTAAAEGGGSAATSGWVGAGWVGVGWDVGYVAVETVAMRVSLSRISMEPPSDWTRYCTSSEVASASTETQFPAALVERLMPPMPTLPSPMSAR